MAILSGVISNVSVAHFGLISPFLESAALLLVALIFIHFNWTENYGSKNPAKSINLIQAVTNIITNRKILCFLLSQTVFESSMYIFVLLWTPMVDSFPDQPVPYGIVFSTFMLSIMVGSQLFSLCMELNIPPSIILTLSLCFSSISFFILGTCKVNYIQQRLLTMLLEPYCYFNGLQYF